MTIHQVSGIHSRDLGGAQEIHRLQVAGYADKLEWIQDGGAVFADLDPSHGLRSGCYGRTSIHWRIVHGTSRMLGAILLEA
jgi:hypothetical protein